MRWTDHIRPLPGWHSGRTVQWAWSFLFIVLVIAITGPFLANEKPYYIRLDGVAYFPLFSGINEATLSIAHPAHSPVDWRNTSFESVWRAPIPYSYTTIDLQTGSNKSPFSKQAVPLRFRHWLGTDAIGHDVLAGMIRGCRISLLIGFGSMLLALLIGVPAGALGAWWGNKDLRVTGIEIISYSIGLILLVFLWYAPVSFFWKILVTVGLPVIMISFFRKKTSRSIGRVLIPVDKIVMGLISIIDGFPAVFLILVLVVVTPVQGWIIIMLIIALLRWPAMARYMRAEVFKMKETNFIKAALIQNISPLRILRKHIVPYAIRPVMISFIFGVSSAILAESTLSYLGIGLPPGEINWGRLLAQSRNHFEAWWLVLFPGCAIFFTLLSLYTIGNWYQKEVGE